MASAGRDLAWCATKVAQFVCKYRVDEKLALVKSGRMTLQEAGVDSKQKLMLMLKKINTEVQHAIKVVGFQLSQDASLHQQQLSMLIQYILSQESKELVESVKGPVEQRRVEPAVPQEECETCVQQSGEQDTEPKTVAVVSVPSVGENAVAEGRLDHVDEENAATVSVSAVKEPRTTTGAAEDKEEEPQVVADCLVVGQSEPLINEAKVNGLHTKRKFEVVATAVGSVVDIVPYVDDADDPPLGSGQDEGVTEVAPDGLEVGVMRWSESCCGSFGAPVCVNMCCRGRRPEQSGYKELTSKELYQLRVLQFNELIRQAQERHANDRGLDRMSGAVRWYTMKEQGGHSKRASGTNLEYPIDDAVPSERAIWYNGSDRRLMGWSEIHRGHYDPVPMDGYTERHKLRQMYDQLGGKLREALGYLREYTTPVMLHSTVVGISVNVGDQLFAMHESVNCIPNVHPVGYHGAPFEVIAGCGRFVVRKYDFELKSPDFVPLFRAMVPGEEVIVPCDISRTLACSAPTVVADGGDVGLYGGRPHINSLGSPVIAVSDGAIVGLHQETCWPPAQSKFHINMRGLTQLRGGYGYNVLRECLIA